ncbi:CRISPR-associated helicase Cas3' [Streptococcus intermedius]
MILAHYEHETDKKQSLEEHSFNVANKAKGNAETIGQGDLLFLLGLYHDLGKADQKFQDKLTKNPAMHVDHSYAGAKYLFRIIQIALNSVDSDKWIIGVFNEIVAYTISAHHGVYDVPMSGEIENSSFFANNKLRYRIQKKMKDYHFTSDIVSFAHALEQGLLQYGYQNLNDLIHKAFENFQKGWEKLSISDDSERDFYCSCFVRLYLSFLKDADILDTINAYNLLLEPLSPQEYRPLQDSYYKSVEDLYASFGNPKTELNRSRTIIGERVKSRGIEDTRGIYRLNLPTGAGKTNLSLRYAVHQMVNQHKTRFFYITPFLSVLEQNAAAIKKTIGKDSVLEHHSNVVQEKEDFSDEFGDDTHQNLQAQYLIDSWDSPVVLTTMVQFFQTLFKTKSANIRRFSHLTNSVLILDEVQSLPIEVTTLFNLTLNFLSQVMNTTIVLCTATQPTYDSEVISHRLVYGGENAEQADIVTLTKSEQKVFIRTELRKFDDKDKKSSLSELADVILESNQSTLIILNTKPAVAKLYQLLENQTERPLYQLSTNMCAQHRLDVIEKIKSELNKDIPLICVSTQLIEAGVDVDFEHVIRSYAGIDSIVQAAGRCNREGKRALGRVTLVNLSDEEEDLTYLKEIRQKKDATESILFQRTSPINVTELNTDFFEKYYADNKEQMDYPISDNETIYDYLSQNDYSTQLKTGKLRQSFKTAGQKMDLIKDESIGVLVFYGDAVEKLAILEEKLSENPYPFGSELLEIKQELKRLQPYTVNFRERDKRLQATRSYLNGQILILQEEYYDKVTGVKKEADSFIL